jgi:hypothetical protein
MKFIRRRVGEGLVTKKIGHNVLGSREVNHFGSIFLNNQPPAADTIGGKIGKGKILVVSVDPNDVS